MKNFIREIHCSTKDATNEKKDVEVTIVFNNEELRKHKTLNKIYEHVRLIKYGRLRDIEGFVMMADSSDGNFNGLRFNGIYSGKNNLEEDTIHGDAEGSIGIFSLSASASTSAGGSHNNHSVADYLNQQKTHMQSSASQAVSATRKAHSVSIGEVSSRTHIEGESEDHFEASSREFSNYNKCHAVTYMFYRLNKKQKIKFELVSIERMQNVRIISTFDWNMCRRL